MTATCDDSDSDGDGNGNDNNDNNDGNNNGDDGNEDNNDSNCHGIAVLPMMRYPPLDLKHVSVVGMLITLLVAFPPGAKASPPA
jgi:hypothetical protein